MAPPDRGAHRTLGDLTLPCLPNVGADADPGTRITGIAVDSREVKDGFVFVAIPGTALDGADFIQFAVRQGAAAVVATPEGVEIARRDIGGLPVPFFVTERPRAWLARLAAAFWGRQPEVVVGVTGTNGKTSVAQFLRKIWTAAGHRAVAFGTLGVHGGGFDEPLGHTTPEPVTLHRLLARLAGDGVTHAAMEASSHGLEQKRLDGVHLAAAGLTNITRDHMDYHVDHDAYVAAKMRLFGNVLEKGGAAVLNADDASFETARAVAKRRAQRVLAVGTGEGADLRILGREMHQGGQIVRYGWEGTEHAVDLKLIGDFQADNVGIAAGLALATGITPETVFSTLPDLEGVRGRMELVARRRNGAAIYVDYAHTPDALARALAALRPHCEGTLVCAFGAGGDRDRGKRPLMGRAAAEGADLVVITDDNPRGEDAAAIRAEVAEGAPHAQVIGGRTGALLAAVDLLRGPGDCLLIAGKGHEQGQEIAGETFAFDDGDQARASVAVLDGREDERAREGAA